jgi:hypothetical protein
MPKPLKEFPHNVFLLQQYMEAFYAAPFEVQMALFPHLAANITELNCIVGLVIALWAVAAATAVTADARW